MKNITKNIFFVVAMQIVSPTDYNSAVSSHESPQTASVPSISFLQERYQRVVNGLHQDPVYRSIYTMSVPSSRDNPYTAASILQAMPAYPDSDRDVAIPSEQDVRVIERALRVLEGQNRQDSTIPQALDNRNIYQITRSNDNDIRRFINIEVNLIRTPEELVNINCLIWPHYTSVPSVILQYKELALTAKYNINIPIYVYYNPAYNQIQYQLKKIKVGQDFRYQVIRSLPNLNTNIIQIGVNRYHISWNKKLEGSIDDIDYYVLLPIITKLV